MISVTNSTGSNCLYPNGEKLDMLGAVIHLGRLKRQARKSTMSKKNRRTRGKQRANVNLSDTARRALDKGNAKQALKDARLCFRNEPSETHRQLLHEATISRAEQLQKGGFQEQAAKLLRELDEAGVTVQEVQQRVDRLRVLLGEQAGGRQSGGSDVAPELLLELADQAVLHVHRRSPAYQQVNEQADRVLAALQAIEKGDDEIAIAQMKEVSRTSPFADWKLFVRGLTFYYASDFQRARSNWDRLEPKRAAHRIAQALLAASGQLDAEQTADLDASVRKLKHAAARDPAAAQLEKLKHLWRAGNWRDLLRSLRSFRQRYGKSHAPLLERITDVLWKRFVRDSEQRTLEQLIRAAPGPALDPKWNRARALMACEDREELSLNALERYWRAYVDDLQHLECLREEDRKIAGGLVCVRLGLEFVQAVRSELHPSGPSPFFSPEPDHHYIKQLQQEAIRHLRDAIRLYPRLQTAHEGLVRLHLMVEDSASAAKAYQCLLKYIPDDYDALQWLVNYYLEEDQPEAAQPHTETAYRLRPRDPETETLVWNQRLAMIRHWTRKRKFDAARRELDGAADHQPADIQPYSIPVLRATVEYKAKNTEDAERHVATASAALDEPTTIWMMMHANAARYSLHRDVKNDFSQRLKKAVQAKCTSQTAGGMARFLAPFLNRNVKYTGMATHRRMLLTYLNRCKRVRWTCSDLKEVCLFMSTVEEWKQRQLRTDLMTKGMRDFPNEPLFPYLRARAEIEDGGPFMLRSGTVEFLLQRAQEVDGSGETPLSPRQREDLKQMLAVADVASEMFSHMAAALGGGEALDDLDDEEDSDDFFDDQWGDDDDDDLEDEDVSRRTSGGRGKRKQKAKSTETQQYFSF